jgi:hypothetical protein
MTRFDPSSTAGIIHMELVLTSKLAGRAIRVAPDALGGLHCGDDVAVVRPLGETDMWG